MFDHELIGISGPEQFFSHLSAELNTQERGIVSPGGKSLWCGHRALAANNLQRLVLSGGKAALDMPQHTSRKTQERAGIQVDLSCFTVRGKTRISSEIG